MTARVPLPIEEAPTERFAKAVVEVDDEPTLVSVPPTFLTAAERLSEIAARAPRVLGPRRSQRNRRTNP